MHAARSSAATTCLGAPATTASYVVIVAVRIKRRRGTGKKVRKRVENINRERLGREEEMEIEIEIERGKCKEKRSHTTKATEASETTRQHSVLPFAHCVMPIVS